MNANHLIAALDSALARNGEDVILRRVYGLAPSTINVDVACRAAVRSWRLHTEELTTGIAQNDLIAIISPTEIAQAQWPGGELPSLTVPDPTLPRRLDQLIVDGRIRQIETVDPISVGGALVRIEMRVLG